MAFDRESTLKKAEKLLRQGRLDAAIAEYERVAEDDPRDWNTANILGDLYARAGQADMAVEQYSRIAAHFARDGFYSKASAVYKKILKFRRDDEATQLHLAEVSVQQGLLADAKSLLNAVAARRRLRSDRRGEAEIVVRLGALDPSDIDARLAGARTLEGLGRNDEAAAAYKSLHADLEEKGRAHEALDALREYSRLAPHDAEARGVLARAALASGDVAKAKDFLSREAAGSDPRLLLELLEAHLEAGEIQSVRTVASDVLAGDAGMRQAVLERAWHAAASHTEAAFACVDAAVDAMVAASDFRDAATSLQEFGRRVPAHIDSLLKLVEICVDGGFEAEMYAAQEQLTDAYLASGQAAEARVIAEDLVAREPWEPAHIERFRRALVMLRVSDPDAEIAERLSGQSPFTATDPFVDLAEAPAAESLPDQAPPALAADAPESEPLHSTTDAETHAAELDLTDALGTLEKGNEDTLDHAFRNLREAAETEAEHADQHLRLARTFLEMQLDDEAIPSLETAAASPRLRFEAASTLGRLLLKRGETDQALEWLERAAEAPPPTDEDGRALLYDFGVALDNAGETARALAVFLQLQADAGDYRDTPGRIDRLARAQTGG